MTAARITADWDDLNEGAFGGVTFDFVNVRDTHTNDLDEQKFPDKAGARIESRTAGPASHSIVAIFVDDTYPQNMYDLIDQLEGGAVKKFVHPIFGESNCACKSYTVNHDSEDACDSATVSIELVEDNDAQASPQVTNTTPARANEVRSLGDSVLVALSAFQDAIAYKNNTAYLAVVGAVNAASSIADNLEATADELSSLDVQVQANGALATCDTAIEMLADYDSTEQFDLSNALLAMSAALRNLAQEIIERRPPLSIFAVAADTNLLSLAHDMGQDADELLTLNSFPDPSLIPAGFKVSAYAA